MSLALIWYLVGVIQGIKILMGVLTGLTAIALLPAVIGTFEDCNFDAASRKACKLVILPLLLVSVILCSVTILLPSKETAKELIVIHYGQEILESDVMKEKFKRFDSIANKTLDKIESKLDEETK